jgi:hypothetical protein
MLLAACALVVALGAPPPMWRVFSLSGSSR